MVKAVSVYQSNDEDDNHVMQIALSREGQIFKREFMRHSRFGRKWNEWSTTNFNEFLTKGFDSFSRISGDKIVLPSKNIKETL